MSDLQCPARVLVVRHGEAAYPQADTLTNDGGWLTELGREQAHDLGQRLAGKRVAAVYTSTMRRARETGQILGEALGLEAMPVEGVQEFSVGAIEGRPMRDPEGLRVFLAWVRGDLSQRWPGAETGEEVVARFVTAVDEIADRHRGETVVLVSHGTAMTLAIPATAGNVSSALARRADLGNCAVAPLDVDGDGWRLVGSWPGTDWEPDA